MATVYAPTDDTNTIDAGRRTLMDKLKENRPHMNMPSSFTASVLSQERGVPCFTTSGGPESDEAAHSDEEKTWH